MLSTKQFTAKLKAKFIVHEIIMGVRTDYDFNRILFTSDNKKNKANCLHNINHDNRYDHAHYLVEMGYLNVFNQDIKVGKKLNAWYKSQLNRSFKMGYIQLFCILYARTKPILDKYGPSDTVEINYFDVIVGNYKENTNKSHYYNECYCYDALFEYTEIICAIIEEWMLLPAEEREERTRPEFKEWLENEKDFIQNIHVIKDRDSYIGYGMYSNYKTEFEEDKDAMITAILKAQSMLVRDADVGPAAGI